jgi:NitT/TauT family transport system permease protein
MSHIDTGPLKPARPGGGTETRVSRPRRSAARKLFPSAAAACVFALAIAVILGGWLLVVGYGHVSRLILPTPADVGAAFYTGVFRGEWLGDIAVTLQETVLGFLVGAACAVVLGALLAYLSALRSGLYPLILAFQTFPKIAVAPLLLAWLGYGLAPKVIIAAMLAFFPVFSNTLAGFLEVDAALVDLFRSMRASPWQELRRLRAPNAMAFIIPSFDVALVLALLGAIAAELAGASAGLGNVIQQRTFLGDTPAVYAVLLLLALLGLAMKMLIGMVTRTMRQHR